MDRMQYLKKSKKVVSCSGSSMHKEGVKRMLLGVLLACNSKHVSFEYHAVCHVHTVL